MAELPSSIGRYEVVSRLGQGGMGSLYLAKDPKIGRLVAIKLVRQEFDSPDARQRFAREAQSAGTLRHPNIVTIFDVDEHEGLPYIAMEYVDGETLSEIVRRKAPYPVAKRVKWIEDLCAGLSYAHRQGVVHRDIKPANLMLDNEGTLKILDFGLARREQSKFTQSQTIIGTPNYMSPEQIRAGDVGPKSDIFAVGAVLYEVIACKEAFPGSVHQAMHKILYEGPTPLEQLQPNIDRGLVTIVGRALEKDADRRYQDLSVMKNDLAVVRQRLENQIDDSAQTLVTPQPSSLRGPATIRTHNMPGSGPPTPGSGPRSSGGSRRMSGTHRITLQKRRAAQIEAHLAEARKFFDAGELEKARDATEQALLFDTEHPLGLQMMDEVAAEEERRQVAAFVASARAELQQGRLDAAERIVIEALQVAPQSAEIQQLRDTIETTRREIERARQIQDMLRRARARFSEGSFEGAIRAVGELLAIDPGNANALDLQTRAQEAIEAREKRAERDAAAQAVVAEARALFDQGNKDSAIAKLEAFAPPHDLVTGFLASLRGEQVAEALPEIAPTPGDGLARRSLGEGGPPTAAFMPGRTDAIPGVRIGTGSRTPIYAGVALAVVVLLAIGGYVMTRPRSDGASASADATADKSAPASGSDATTAPAAPTLPPPAVVTPPVSLSGQAPQNENDRETMAAYKLLSGGDYVGASRLAAQIAKRDPRYANLPDLRAQIRTVEETEKQRAAAAAAAAEAAKTVANTPPPVSAPPTASTPAPPLETPAKPGPSEPAFTVAPGGGFAAPSEPPSPALRGEVERPGIEAAIAQYANAVSRKDLAAASNARTFTQKEAESWRNIFKTFDTYQLAAKVVGDPAVEGDRATVRVEERIQYKQKRGDITITMNPRQVDYRLEKIAGRWHILPPS